MKTWCYINSIVVLAIIVPVHQANSYFMAQSDCLHGVYLYTNYKLVFGTAVYYVCTCEDSVLAEYCDSMEGGAVFILRLCWPKNVLAALHWSSPELDSVKLSSSIPFILSAVICTWVPRNEQAEGCESPWLPCGCIGYTHVGEISHDLRFHLVVNYLCISQLSPSSRPLWTGTSTVSVPNIGQYLQN